MKLLFDENLSWRLPALIDDLFWGSVHVDKVALNESPDARIWEFAAREGFVIVSKDKDFRDRALRQGSPPKVIILVMGNVSTSRVADTLRARYHDILAFGESADALLILD